MPKRSDSVDSTYKLRKNPLNMRSVDGSDLILSRVDRLAEMANSNQHQQGASVEFSQTNFSNPPKTFSASNASVYIPLQYPPNKDFNKTYSSHASKSSISLSSSHSIMSDANTSDTIATQSSVSNSPATSTYLADKEPLALIKSHQEKLARSNPASPVKARFFDKDACSENISLTSPSSNNNTHHETIDIDSDEPVQRPRLPHDQSDSNILASLALPSLEPDPESKKVSSFLPLELSLATEDFSSLVMQDFSHSSFSYAYGSSRPLSTQSQKSTASSLGRKNTIGSTSGRVRTSMSTASPLLFERMKSLRIKDHKEYKESKESKIESDNSNQLLSASDSVSNPKTRLSSSFTAVSAIYSNDDIPSSAAASILTSTPVDLERDNSRSSNFTIFSTSSTNSNQPKEEFNIRGPPLPLITTPVTSHLDPYYPLTAVKRRETQVVSCPSPARTVSSASSSSFDSHIAAQLCVIPSPVFNAVTFTPPLGAVIIANEDEDGDTTSVFSCESHLELDGDKSLEAKSADEVTEGDSDIEVIEPIEEKEPENPIDAEDRGRLFVRIEGLQGLQLPLVQFRHPMFTMTLDNGVQSVTIDPLPITATNPGVGQEFELVVGEDLQFILTFQAHQDLPSSLIPKDDEDELEKKKEKEEEEEEKLLQLAKEQEERKKELESATIATKSHPSTPQSSPKKQSRLRGFFSSPKKKNTTAITAANQQGLSENNKATTSTTIAIEETFDMRAKLNKDDSPKPPASPTKPNVKKEYKPKDIWEGLVGSRGEFGRCYLVESQYEKEVYGRPRTFNLVLYNEWSYNEVPIQSKNPHEEPEAQGPSLADLLEATSRGVNNSSRDKKGAGALLNNGAEAAALAARYRSQLKSAKQEEVVKYKKIPIEPYKIATIQVTMMYIPRATMEGRLPGSMKNAVRELSLAKMHKNIALDGYLSQEGGDCFYWRRRFFTLRAAELVGHTEDTKKVRTVLNLANVKSILDTEHMTHQEKREMMASCMYHDRAFRMTFNDGEVITFYADSVDSKNAWMDALNISITHCTGKSFEWTDVVMSYHDFEKEKLEELREKRSKRDGEREKAIIEANPRIVTAQEMLAQS